MEQPAKKRGRPPGSGAGRFGGRKPSGADGIARTELLGAKVTPAVKADWLSFVETQGCRSFGEWVERFAMAGFPVQK